MRFKMMLLMQFNKAQEGTDYKLSYRQILKGMGLPLYDRAIGHQLMSMCHPSVRVLTKSPNSSMLESDHLFAVNAAFSNPHNKIVIPIIHFPSVATAAAAADNKQKQVTFMHLKL